MSDLAMPAFSIGKEKRDSVYKRDLYLKNVGPATYNPNKTFSLLKSPEFTMGARLKLGSSLS